MKETRRESAWRKHFEYYSRMLMTETDRKTLEPEFLQIALAVRRMKAEEVGSKEYHPGEIEVKYAALANEFVGKYLEKLVKATATKEDIINIEKSIEAIELGEVEYPVSINFLKEKLKQLKQS